MAEPIPAPHTPLQFAAHATATLEWPDGGHAPCHGDVNLLSAMW